MAKEAKASKKANRLTDEQREQIKQLRKDGVTIKDVASKVGCSTATVMNVSGAKKPRSGKKLVSVQGGVDVRNGIMSYKKMGFYELALLKKSLQAELGKVDNVLKSKLKEAQKEINSVKKSLGR